LQDALLIHGGSNGMNVGKQAPTVSTGRQQRQLARPPSGEHMNRKSLRERSRSAVSQL
jgi:hypothetical protein